MPTTLAIMNAVRTGLDSIRLVAAGSSDTDWTRAITTALCRTGRERFQYQAYASGVDDRYRDGEEWLYDVIWLKHDNYLVVSAPLVAECQWWPRGKDWDGYWNDITHDFDKLLLPRASVRLMIFDGNFKSGSPGSKGIAERLAARVREFKNSTAEDSWLLAAWERCGPPANESGEKDWRFRYYKIGMNAILWE